MKVKRRTIGDSKQGFLLFYVMGTVALLTVFAFVSAASAALEARSARNKIFAAQAHAHAEAGVQMVRTQVEASLDAGDTLEQALSGLSVSPPTGIEFDTISTFEVIVRERIFQFTSTGRSGDSEVSINVQYRRDDLFKAGIFGHDEIDTQPNVSIYGYDSRDTTTPTAGTSTGNASVGSNYDLDFGNRLTLDGTILLGADPSGTAATCSGCYGYDSNDVGYIDPDPLGVNGGGELSQTFDDVVISNNNSSNSAISGTVFSTRPGETVTFTAGNYYLTEIDTAPRTNVIIDASGGPVKFYVDGEIYFAPNNGLSLNSPFDFQIYSKSTEDIRIQPNGSLSMFLYAPNAEIGLWPNGSMLGAFWGNEVQMQPGGNIFVDTSLQDRWLSDELKVHTRFETRAK